jgi:dTDP-4-dehydrorhamnose reductase
MRLTIFGAGGLLGKALMRGQIGDELTGLRAKDADIRDAAQVERAVAASRPDWIILAAAYTDVDGCEANPDLAFDVNCRGAVNIAQAAKQHGARLLFISTDYVFDGNKTTPYEADDARNPQSVYGKSKAQAEVELLQIVPEVCILRTSWLFGPDGKCFPETILKLAGTRKELDVVDDQRGSPTYSVDLARALAEVCRNRVSGIVHATNRGDCSWFEFAQAIVSEAGLATAIRPVSSAQFVRPARRPKYSVLSARSLEQYRIVMPEWREALGRYLKLRSSA